jgi:hypothetical protein
VNPINKKDNVTTKVLNFGKYKMVKIFKKALASIAFDKITYK